MYFSQVLHKITLEYFSHGSPWEDEVLRFTFFRYPGSIPDSTTADDTMYMRVKRKCLSPGVKDGRKSDIGTQMTWIPSQRKQGVCRRVEEQPEDTRPVAHGQCVKLMRQCEYDVIISRRKEIGGFELDPFIFPACSTRWAVPVSTAVILPVYVVTFGVVAGESVHSDTGGTTMLQFIKNSPTVRIEFLNDRMCKYGSLE